MSSIVTAYEHLTFNEQGVAIIEHTRMKVSQLVSEVMAYGWSPQELHFQHPHLSMGQIHSALAYYWDHKQEVERQIEEELTNAGKLRASVGETPLVQRLKAKGLLK